MKTTQTVLIDPAEIEPPLPEGACLYWNVCGNFPHGHPESANEICDDCLDRVRREGDGRPD